MHLDDGTIMQKLKQGDVPAYQSVYNTYYKPLCVYALGLTNGRAEAEDIVQDAFLKLWEKREDLEVHTSVKAFLYATVYNKFIDEYRKAKREAEHLDTLRFQVLNSLNEAEDSSDLQERKRLLEKAISELPDKCKTIFELNKREGLTHDEIAAYLGISSKTVENQMLIAFRKLRESINSLS